MQREGSHNPLDWLLAQHNEHRIVWAKAISLVETNMFKLPPGQSALYQNLAPILGCAGLWHWLSQRLLQRPDLRLITALAGALLQVLLEVSPNSPGCGAAPTVSCTGTAPDLWPHSPLPRLLLQAI
jgi:hypothetical protein